MTRNQGSQWLNTALTLKPIFYLGEAMVGGDQSQVNRFIILACLPVFWQVRARSRTTRPSLTTSVHSLGYHNLALAYISYFSLKEPGFWHVGLLKS